MSKSLVYLAVGALALTACTSEDVIDNVATSSRNVIKFENVVNKHSRAVDITSGSLKHFNVFGFYTMPGNDLHAHQVFNNIPVERADDKSDWGYTDGGERYWVPGAKYYFYAYSCNNMAISSEMATGIKYILDMEDTKPASQRVLEIQNYVCDNNHQHDLIFASNTGATETDAFAGIKGLENGNVKVYLEFNHILSKVKAKFTTKFPEEYEIVISDITIQDIRDMGNYDPNRKWHGVTRTADAQPLKLIDDGKSLMIKNVLVGEEDNKKQMSTETEQYYVIPCGSDDPSAVEVALKFTIDVYIHEDRTEKVMSKTLTGKFIPTWEDGFQYVYNVDINGTTTNMEVIAFTTKVNEFEDEKSDDIIKFTVVNNEIK